MKTLWTSAKTAMGQDDRIGTALILLVIDVSSPSSLKPPVLITG